MSQEIRFIDPDKLLEANRDYIDRIERQGLDAVYDSTLDSLFIEIGGPTESLSEHLADNIMVRVDPETLQIQGLEIVDFFDDFLPNNRLVQNMISDMGLREGEDYRVPLMEPRFKHIRDVIEALISHVSPPAEASLQ